MVIHALQWLPLFSWGADWAHFSKSTQRRLILLASRASGLLLIYASIVTLLGRARFDAPPSLAVILYVAVAALLGLSTVVILGISKHILATRQKPT